MPVRGLWIPGGDELVDIRHEVDAERQAYVQERLAHLEHLNKELRAIDPYLELVKVRDDAPDDDPAVKPGFWHVVRRNPGAADSWMPVTDDIGRFVEPTSRIFERLAEGNMWNDSYGRRQRKRAAERAAEKERAEESRKRRLAEEMQERYLAATRTFVSMDRSTPWTQNASPNARRDAAGRKKAA